MEFITLSLHGFRICLFQRYSHTWTQKNFTISSYFHKLKTKSVRISKVHFFPADNVLYTGSLLDFFLTHSLLYILIQQFQTNLITVTWIYVHVLMHWKLMETEHEMWRSTCPFQQQCYSFHCVIQCRYFHV